MKTALEKTTDFLDLPGCEFSRTGLVISPGLPFERWEKIGSVLRGIEGSIQFWIGDWIRYGEHAYKEMYSQAVDETGYEGKSLRNMVYVAENVEMSRRRDNLPFSAHAEVASLTPAKQEEWLDRAESEHLNVHDLRQAIRQERLAERLKETPLKSATHFPIILADPPWRYEHSETDSRQIENQYPTMELEQICALPINEVAAADSVLFLWATSPKVHEAMSVIDTWGFDYRTCMVWIKDKIGMGYYARQQHELLLIAKRGEISPPLPANRPSSVINAPRGRHSEKPEGVYGLIEIMYPDMPKIELFSRKAREGWASWGNEIEST